jgi:hypothetical protein
MDAEDLILSEAQYRVLLDYRGGCHCATTSMPPCGNCSSPIRQDEAEYLGFIPEPRVCVDATGVDLTEGNEYDVAFSADGLVEARDDKGNLTLFFEARFK